MLGTVGFAVARLGVRLACRITLGLLAFATGTAVVAEAKAADERIGEAVDPLEVKPEKQTLLQLYVRASSAIGYLRWHRDMLLIDVRPAPDLLPNGVAAPTAAHIPFLVEAAQLPAPGGMTVNAKFEQDIRAVLAARRLGMEATLLLICSHGILSARAADLLAEAGFANVYTVIDGFDGDPGPDGLARVNGWRALGLPTVPQVHRQPEAPPRQ